MSVVWLFLASLVTAAAQPSLMENLGRGVVAVRSSTTEVFVSWRVLGTDPSDIAFNLYRQTGADPAVLLNPAPITGATNFVDTPADFTQAHAYYVRPILFGAEQAASEAFTIAAGAPVQPYLRVPLNRPAGGTVPDGSYTYSPNDMTVADLDGDGEYELIVKWEPSNARDAASSGYTGNTLIDAYTIDGVQLWRIDLGVNVRAGPHDTPFFAYDLDGDGKAEISIRTAAGSRDGLGNFVANPAKFSGPFPAEPFDHNADYRNSTGRSLVGPEFMTIFDGMTGEELSSTKFLPARHPDTDFPTSQQLFDQWGDNFGNRAGRYYPPGVAYLDGQRPSIVWGRGYAGGQSGHPGRIGVAAWNWRDGQLTELWEFDSLSFPPDTQQEIGGQGGHTAVVADLTGDGRDDIVYGQVFLDADGQLISTGSGHGDAIHVSQMDPDRTGVQVYMPHESPGDYGPNAVSYRDGTGELIWGVSATGDIGRGVAADIDPRFRGYEMWASGGVGGLYNAQTWVPNAVLGPRGLQVASSRPGQINHVVWWTGDLLRELLDGTTISKWNWDTNSVNTVLSPGGIASINGTKSNPNLQADIFGDWREEVIWRESGNDAIRIYTTTIPTEHRIYTLMHDRQYRMNVTSQNVGYNQPPHPSFFLGHEMDPAPVPNIVTSLSVLLGPPAPVFTGISDDTGLFNDDQVTNDTTLVLHGTAQADATVTISRSNVGVIGSTVAGGDGVWSFDYTGTVLPEGTRLFSATGTDGDGNTGTATFPPFQVTVDTTAPVAPVIDSIVASGDDLIVAGTGEPFARVAVTLVGTGPVGTADANEDGVWAVLVDDSLVPVGEAAFTASQTDLAGNAGPASAQSGVNTALAVPVITGIENDTGVSPTDGITNDNTLVINGTGAPGTTVAVSFSGAGTIGTAPVGAGGAWSFDYTGTVLADGTYGITAVTTSGSGSDSLASAPFEVTVNTTTPFVESVERLDPSAANTSAETVTFRVIFSEEVAGVEPGDFTLTVTGGAVTGNVASVSASSGEVIDVVVDSLDNEGTFRLDVPAGPGIADTAGNALAAAFTDGQSYNRLVTGSGSWIQPLGGLWSTRASWEGGIIAAGINNGADFSQVDIDGAVTVDLDSPRTVGTLIFGDTDLTTPGGWVVDDGGNPANALTLQVSGGAPVVSVAPSAFGVGATLNVGVTSTQGINKQGAGTLVLTRPNTLSGSTNVAGGTLRLEQDATYNASTVSIASGGSRLNIAGGTFTATGTTTSNAGGGSALIVDGGTVTFAQLATNNSAGGLIRINGGTVTATGVNLPRSNDNNTSFGNIAGGGGNGFVVAGGNVTINGVVGLGTNNSNGVMSVLGDGVVTVNGPVRVGDLNNSSRGGALQVIENGTLVVTNASEGIILTRRNNNTTLAFFDGGTTITEVLSIGASGVTTGSATVNVRGGALYLGSGGLVRTGTPTTNINLQSGILGAQASWSSSVAMTLSTGGNINLRAADAGGAPANITLAGVLSGAGGFTKTGGGVLTLSAVNTFSGTASVTEGTLNLTGSLAGSASVQSATLVGAGSIGGSLTLGDGSRLSVNPLVGAFPIGGSLNKAGTGPYQVLFQSNLAPNTTYTVATFASSDFTGAEFSASGAGVYGSFEVNGGQLQFVSTDPILAPDAITSPTDASGKVDEPFSYAIEGTNLPTSYAATGLPAGLEVDADTGLISGTPTEAGTFLVEVSASNESGTASTVVTLVIAKGDATVTLSDLVHTYDGSGKSATATTAPAGLTVNFTYDGSADLPVNVGSYAVVATINDANYAGSATDTLVINAAPATITLGNLLQRYDGLPKPVDVVTNPEDLDVDVTYDGSDLAPIFPGSYAVEAVITDPNHEGSASGTLVIEITALVRRGLILNADIDGSAQILNADNNTLNGTALISGDLLVPGSPSLRINGNATHVGVVTGLGAADPSGHVVTLNGSSGLRYLVTQVDAIDLPAVAAPPAPAGTANVTVNNAAQVPADFSNVRNLTLNGSAGSVAVPPGTYGQLTANASTTFVLGVAGAEEPAEYNLQGLTLNGSSRIEVVGPVVITVANSVTLNSSVEEPADDDWLTLRIASGGLTLNGNASFHGRVAAPNGTVTINGSATLTGAVAADRLVINGNGLLTDPEATEPEDAE